MNKPKKEFKANKNHFDVLLDHACFDGDIVEVRKMLKRGANVHYADDNPLYNAIADGNVAVVKLLVEYGANFNSLCGNRYLNEFKTKTLFEFAKYCSDDEGKWIKVYNYLNSVRRRDKIKNLED